MSEINSRESKVFNSQYNTIQYISLTYTYLLYLASSYSPSVANLFGVREKKPLFVMRSWIVKQVKNNWAIAVIRLFLFITCSTLPLSIPYVQSVCHIYTIYIILCIRV